MAEFEIVGHCRPDIVGEIRRVNYADTSGIYSIVPGDPNNRATLANNGRGSWLGWSKAAFWNFSNGLCSLYDSDNEQTEQHLIIA